MSELLKDKIAKLNADALALQAKSSAELEVLRQKYLSKKGEVSLLFDEFKTFPKEEKAQWGAPLNQLKRLFETRMQELKDQLADSPANRLNDAPDLTRTPDPIALGTRHPLSLVREQIIDIFSRIGFTVADGPEVEDDKHVFGMLNFAPEHPARDMQDTFFVEKENGIQKPTDILLRTHTSSVQTRVMTAWSKALNNDPENAPHSLRVLCPGRVFRNEAISARAHCFFHQVEGLYIDKNVSFADLRQALLYFAKEMFGPETQIRLRPSYFPFTEPSAEMDISCDLCGGKGCAFCKGTGWVEILGCGMVDPNVLESCGIDSNVYTGYAFGLGVERIANLKYRVKDLRLFSENDVRFLEQFQSC
ncbi:MAG: phenylalanine--tRNA ligase subunit alpha [Paludibacteraceae bacterium]|nr:phenylalanine--tRNA ligase subunit alpha [Paludibacteraceae bacterium]